MKQIILPMAMAIFGVPAVFAFDGHTVSEGPLRLQIEAIQDVSRYDAPYPITVTLANSGLDSLQVRLRMSGLVDPWRAVGATETCVSVSPGAEQQARFEIQAAPGTYSALYPVHIDASFAHAGQQHKAHAVRVFETQFTPAVSAVASSQELPVISVPTRGVLLLTAVKAFRCGWSYFEKPVVSMPIGWQGAAQPSRASFTIGSATRGTTRTALNMHPAWWQGRGTVFVDYRLRLPATTPILFSFGNAIRDVMPSEPPSDGVSFRAWIGDRIVFERHTGSRIWVDGEVDLSEWKGQEILLRLECHPGPDRDTTCDSAFWGAPAIVVGERPVALTEQDRERLRERAQATVKTGQGERKGVLMFPLADGLRAAVVLGPNGLADGVIALGNESICTLFDGLRISVLDHPLGQQPSMLAVSAVETSSTAEGGVRVLHRCRLGNDAFDLTVDLFAEAGGLRIRLDCPQRISDLAAGPFSQTANRVYYGHGYCIVEPQAFRAGYGGHDLSTSHVGFDFDEGLSLLMACDNPPDYLEVDPGGRCYTLHTHMGGTLTFVPSLRGVVDCTQKYRILDDRKPSPGFARKAGRFVFDVWGGPYADNARLMQQMIDYGLTDSLLTLHVWQRWGYDYRLPDVFPPNPELGSTDDLQQLGSLCTAAGIPWGLHDNYIDFYPDADQFNYDHICFTKTGEPIKAWLNTGRDAQSYRFRPDHIMPFVQRNLQLIKPSLRPSHYFIDVFTSINMFDFYDRQGTFHSSLETRKHWGEAFRWIQDYLGPGTITTSEAGDDQLVGYLDGADCQHLMLSPAGGYFQHRLLCQDWERFPWFDAVLHDRFSLHGVGYPGRYEGGRSRRDHGIESDDYLSAELLLGHALMIDRSSMPRGAVRKYWLAQDLIRSLATDTIDSVQFAEGDIHRVSVKWNSGAQVHVNRGVKDWKVAGKVLPQYGYLAVNGPVESTIERVDGVIIERSRRDGQAYVNARGFNPDPALEITPAAKGVEYRGGRQFTLPILWRARQSTPKDAGVLVQFKSSRSERYDKIAFQAVYVPAPGSSSWQGDVVTGAQHVIEIPERFGAGEYEIHLALGDPKTRTRYVLDADETGQHHYLLGRLVAEGAGAQVTAIRLEPHKLKDRPEPRWNVARKAIALGAVTTAGAFRYQWNPERIVVTPLPDEPSFEVTLDAAAMASRPGVKIMAVRSMDVAGNVLRDVPVTASGSTVAFTTMAGEFSYGIILER